MIKKYIILPCENCRRKEFCYSPCKALLKVWNQKPATKEIDLLSEIESDKIF